MDRKLSTRTTGLYRGRESSWGTPAAPTVLLTQTGFNGGESIEFENSEARNGTRTKGERVDTSRQGSASIPFEAKPDELGHFLKDALGLETVTPANGAHDHVFKPTNGSSLPSATLKPQYLGYGSSYWLGAMLNSFSLDIAPKGIVRGSAEYIFKHEADIEAAVTAYSATTDAFTAASHGLVADQTVVLVGDVPAEMESDRVYYVLSVDSDTFQLAVAQGGAAIALGSDSLVELNLAVVPWVDAVATDKPFFQFKHFKARIDGQAFDELTSASIRFDNGLDAEDFRANQGASTASITTGEFMASVSFDIVANRSSRMIRKKVRNGQEIDLELELDTGVVVGSTTYKVLFKFPRLQLSGGEPDTSGNTLTMSPEGEALSHATGAVIVTLTNDRAGAY